MQYKWRASYYEGVVGGEYVLACLTNENIAMDLQPADPTLTWECKWSVIPFIRGRRKLEYVPASSPLHAKGEPNVSFESNALRNIHTRHQLLRELFGGRGP